MAMLKLAALATDEEERDRYAAIAIACMRASIKTLLPARREEPTE